MTRKSLYWQMRAMADEKRANALARSASAEIKKMYRGQYLQVVRQIDALEAQLDRGKPLSRTQLWNYSRWRTLEKQLGKFVDESTRFQRDKVHETLEKVFEQTIGQSVSMVRGSQMTLSMDPDLVIGRAWSGEHYSERIWKNQAAIADRMKHSVTDMMVQGKSAGEIKKTVMREFGVAYNAADRLVETETSYVYNQSALLRYKRSGTGKVRWLLGPEDGACAVCRERADAVYRIDDAPLIPAHPRCRCTYAPVVELAGEDVPVTGDDVEQKLDKIGHI